MLRLLRRNAIALVALVFAITGTGIAASRYLITSSSQIKPSVRRELGAQAVTAALAKKGTHAIVARVRSTAPLTTTGEATLEVPLSAAAWTQGGEEIDLLSGQMKVVRPTEPECKGTYYGKGFVEIFLNGQQVGSGGISSQEGGGGGAAEGTDTLYFVNPELFEPGTNTVQTVTVKAWDNCAPGPGHFTIKSLAIDAIGVR